MALARQFRTLSLQSISLNGIHSMLIKIQTLLDRKSQQNSLQRYHQFPTGITSPSTNQSQQVSKRFLYLFPLNCRRRLIKFPNISKISN